MHSPAIEQTIADQISGLDKQQGRFESLWAKTERRALRMALQLTRNRADAEDLVSETYFKAWRGFDSYIPGKPFLNWLLRIMQRAFLDRKRRENPIRKADSLTSMVSPNSGDVQDIPLPDGNPSAEDEILMEEFGRDLRDALLDLPDLYREAIELCDIEERSYTEIAELQGTTIGTVRSRIHRGRKLLRKVAQKRGLIKPIRA